MIEIFTDGGYNPRHDIGAWAAVFVENGEVTRETHGAKRNTSPLTMELTAVVEALSVITPGSEVVIHTDCSELKVKAEWIRDEEIYPAGDFALWRDLQRLMIRNQVRFELVKGHGNSQYNWKAHNLCRWSMNEEMRK